jgi:2-amino-4-hydroxy-6-hydroxymethyldihydropteridine diphosphokinase
MDSVYLGLGSNLGDSFSIIKRAFLAISNTPDVHLLKTSRLYQTTPVSDIPQNDYINAVCKFQTSLQVEELFLALRKIEIGLGKRPKPKAAPREIDIDILFFGPYFTRSETLQIPHLRWKERLFVLMPLADLTEEITYPIDNQGSTETIKLQRLIDVFTNPHRERVLPLNKTDEWGHH